MVHLDHTLARRLEELICAEFRRLAQVALVSFPQVPAECVEVADGVALWLGEGSPVNLAVGLAMHGPVDEADLESLEVFYRERGQAAVLSMCPLADYSLLVGLGRGGWRVAEFEHVFVRELGTEEAFDRLPRRGSVSGISPSDPALEVRVCLPEEREVWARTAARGFAEGTSPERAHEEFGKIMAEREEAILVLARLEGQPAGTGCLIIDGGVGWLSGDSTLPQYRGRGIQQAIQRHRLQLAREAACDLAVTEAAPGSVSQRNIERVGFRIAYTHVEFTKGQAGLWQAIR